MMARNRWKTAAIILAPALVATNAWWLYATVDQAVTIHYDGVGAVQDRAQTRLLAELLPSYPRDVGAREAYEAMRARHPEIVKLAGDTVEISSLSFIHQDGKLARVVPFDPAAE